MNTKPRKRRHIGGKLFLTLILLLALSLLASNYWLQTTDYQLYSAQLPQAFDGYKITLLTDLHSAAFGADNQRLLKAVEREQPDIVLLGGDMVNSSDRDFSGFISLAEQLTARYPVYFVVGNHEQALDDYTCDSLLDQLREKQVTVLDSEKVELSRGEQSIDLYGLWYGLRFYSARTSEYSQYHVDVADIDSWLGAADEQRFSILLTHNPFYFPSYAAWGADLTLCGHVHGGMIRIPGRGGLFSPERDFFPEYDAGRFDEAGSTMIVSRGLGNGKGFRWLNCPEIVSITLNCE